VGSSRWAWTRARWRSDCGTTRFRSFSHVFTLFTWNLINRAVNTKELMYSHLHWKEDALCVPLPKSKTAQVGKQRPSPKHVYANPADSVICPILAFGLHTLLASAASASETGVFPGGDQQTRSSKALIRCLDSEEGKARLSLLGLTLSDVGTHSIRKGASSYVLGGLAGGGPSAVSVLLRGEWAVGSVNDRHWKHRDAGDQYVGRFRPPAATLPGSLSSADSERVGVLL
jgi:hypothetical protein